LARNSRVEEDLVDQLFNSSEKRLARILLLLANFGKEGRPDPIIAKISQETLAEMIGTTRSRVREQLSLHEEFEAVAAENGSKGVQATKAGQIDLVIMDVGLPDIDGREAVRILRRNGFKAPIIMLTGHDTDSDTILGLESGANDYVTKPFRFAVLLARIRAQLRQHETSEDAVFTIGPYTFRPRSKLLLDPMGNKVRLTRRRPRSCATSTAPAGGRYRGRRCCGTSGVTIRESPRTRSRRTSID
jgi:CheY-like chemotaxis protein